MPARRGLMETEVSRGGVEEECVKPESLGATVESFCSGDGARRPSSGSAEALGHVRVGQLDLAVGRAGVGELIPGVSVLEVPPQTRHLSREIVVAVLLGHNLQERWR